MKFEIKNRFSGNIIFELETKSFKLCVETAVKYKVDLFGAVLSGADLSGANLFGANLYKVDLFGADLSGADLSGANLSWANLSWADLSGANLYKANLYKANLYKADLAWANLYKVDLFGADLSGAVLSWANLYKATLFGADLSGADLSGANLYKADLFGADLSGANNTMVKTMGVETGNYYWKRFGEGLINNKYQYVVGINKLRTAEVFASDERITCSHPGFHFASRSWCAVNYADRPLEAKIKIPEGAQINEPWTTDGKASSDMIEIIQVFDVKTGEDVTSIFKKEGDNA